MRKILALLWLISVPAWAANIPGSGTVYVDTAAGANNATCGASSGAGACATLQYILNTRVWDSMTGDVTISCAGATADATAITVPTKTGNSSSAYIIIRGNLASGTWDATKYHATVSDANVIDVRAQYVWLDRLQLSSVTPTANSRQLITFASGTFGAGTNLVKASRMIMIGHGNASYSQLGFGGLTVANLNLDIWDVIAYGIETTNSGNHYLNVNAASETINVYSSTFIGAYRGIRYSAGTLAVKNSYFGGAGNACLYGFGVPTLVTTGSSDTSGSTGLQSIAVNATNFTNVTGGSENFHLPDTSALRNKGTDTSGDSAPLNFTYDIDGETPRVGVWDVGADENQTAAVSRKLLLLTGVGE